MAGLLPHRAAPCIAPERMASPLPRLAGTERRPIVLVGMMGAGKTTVGRRLARRLGLPFADADEEIERAADCPIAEIFERFGEAAFRDGERRVIARLIESGRKVLATGGGAFLNEQTRALILDRCIAVWLDAGIDTLAERVGRRDTRPLLRGRDAKSTIAELGQLRNPIYAEAHIRISTEPAPHQEVVERIVAALPSAG